MPTFRTTLTALVAVALLTLLAGCGGQTPATNDGAPAPIGLTLRDSYVKAVPEDGEMPMSAIFGVLANTSDRDITLVRGTSDVAGTVELHEMAIEDGKMKMQPREGGFVVPAGGELALEPGGLHVMLIGLTRDIKAGDTVTATLTTADGQDLTVEAVGRDLPNANESYAPEGEMDMGQDG